MDQVTKRECFIKDFPRNVTFKVRKWNVWQNCLLFGENDGFKVGETVRLNCNTNCPHTWWFSDSDTASRRQIFSDFYNPPYFYLMV